MKTIKQSGLYLFLILGLISIKANAQSFVEGGKFNNTGNSGNSATVTLANTGVGNLIVAFGVVPGTTQASNYSCSDTLGNNYTVSGGTSGGGFGGSIAAFCWTVNKASGSDQVTFKTSDSPNNGAAVAVAEYSGIALAPLDVAAGNNSVPYGSSQATPTVTTSNIKDLVIAGLSLRLDGTSAPSIAGFTTRNNAVIGDFALLADKIVTSAGVQSGNWTWSGSANSNTSVIAFKTTGTAVSVLVTISIAPTTAAIPTGSTQQFTSLVSGSTNTGVTWKTTAGTISSAGLFTAPTTAGTVTVTATSVADITKSATSTVTISAPTPILTAVSPVISPSAGIVAVPLPVTITITDTTAGASIYYTLDGSTPSITSIKYSAPFPLTAAGTIKAIAIASGYLNSSVTSVTYVTMPLVVVAPAITPAAGTYTFPQTISITDITPTSTIYYTIDGSTPSVNATKYVGPFSLTSAATVKAMGVATNYTNSSITSVIYTAPITVLVPVTTPTITLTTSLSTSPMGIVIADSTAGATIYYTLDGTTPTTNSTQYTTPIPLSSTPATIEAMARVTGYLNSAVISKAISSSPVVCSPSTTNSIQCVTTITMIIQ